MGLTPKQMAGKAMNEVQLAKYQSKIFEGRLEKAEAKLKRKDRFIFYLGYFSIIFSVALWLYDKIAPLFTWQSAMGFGFAQVTIACGLGLLGLFLIIFASV